MKTIMNPKALWALLFLCCSSLSLQAQFQITGRVVFGSTQEPVPGYEVRITLPEHDQEYTTVTNEQGIYKMEWDWTSAEKLRANVEVVDLCTGEIQIQEFPEDNGEYTNRYIANFVVCRGINPPPPPYGCQAYFSYEQLKANPPTALFFDLSYASDSAATYHWDFGEGSTSNEPAPTHEFPEVGVYEVTLTITSDSCNSTVVQEVWLRDSLDCVCPAVYNPVCVTLDDGNVLTFNNRCEAECAGFDAKDWTACEPNNCGCPEFYDPVCVIGATGDSLRFSNICFAECAGYAPDQVEPCNPINNCDCPQVYDPVCVINDAWEKLTFPNECLARCAGYSADAIVPCDDECSCPEYYDPVCVQLDDGDIIEFPNRCFAKCEGYGPTDFVTCDSVCVCPAVIDPVCVYTAAGELVRFQNACRAECAGYGPNEYQKCEPEPCVCPEYYSPVCAVVEGDTLTFPNICFAECEGFGADEVFACNPNGACDCPDVYDPVCAMGMDSIIYTFQNSCIALCRGFTEDQLFTCDDPCACPDYYDPVCFYDAEGNKVTFPNRCEAICAGYTEDQLFKCDVEPQCDCDMVYDPVCVYTPGGSILRFANPCEARCAGYDENVWVKCNDSYCRARFRVEYVADTLLAVQFVNTSVPVGDSIAVEWYWEFGDGTVSNEASPLHQFPHEGVYEVRLTISTESGCTNTYREQIVVGDQPYGTECEAMFFFDQEPNDPYAFQFHDMSLGEIVAWKWYFGDGTSSDEPAPHHRYEEAGIYIVSLSVTAIDGCTNLMSVLIATDDDIVYNPDCHALFLPLIRPESNQVSFLNFSTAGALETHWDFGDGNTSTQLMPIHTYEQAGTYTVTLTVTTQSGCSSSYSATINLAVGNFTAAPEYDFRTTTNTDEEFLPASEVRIFPNPVSTELWLDMSDHPGGRLQWRIFSIEGRAISQGQEDLAAGHQRFSITTSELPAGVYAIQLVNERGMATRKFVKK